MREIAKTPDVPPLTEKAIQLLSSLCFRKNDTKIPKVDCFFLFGTSISFRELSESLKPLVDANLTRTILITGGIETYRDSRELPHPESEVIYQHIKSFLPQTMKVILEKKSQNTYENVHFGLELLSEPISSLCMITKSFHAGRAYLTLKRFLKSTEIFQRTFNPLYPHLEVSIQVEDWHKYPEIAARVWGEFLRIKRYGEKGDLSLNEIQGILDAIDRETQPGNEYYRA